MGHGDLAENVAKSELMDKVKGIIKDAKEHMKIGSQGIVFEEGKKLTAEDLKTPQDPEQFTKSYIVEGVFDLLKVNYQTGERRFKVTDGFRKVDYGPSYKTINFLVEAKPINGDLDSKSKDSAVNQIKGIFRLHEAKVNYSFGIATDGLRWIFISNDGEQVADCDILNDFAAMEHFITGKEKVTTPKKQAKVSKRFYEWYNALLHGGSYRDLKGKQRKILKESCLVESVLNVPQEDDREEIAQVFINRLIFIKFLQAKGIIKEDVLEHLTSLSQDILDLKLRQLFFGILNTEVDERVDPDPNFSDIPYLNGSLFTRGIPEEKNSDYRIKADVLQEVIRFLDTFRFVSETETAEESIDPEILGFIFERAMTATDRKGTGAYYTPKYITNYISENTIYPYILERSREYLKKEKGYKDEELPKEFNDILKLRSLTLSDVYGKVVQKITVCDPACGSGAFLLDAADVLFDIYAKIEDSLGKEDRNLDITLKKVILKDNIYGVDINHRGIEIAKLRLWLWMADSYDPEGKIEALPNIEYNIRSGNSLVGFVDVGKFKEAKVSMDDYLGMETPIMDLIEKRDELLKDYKFASGEKARELKKQIEDIGSKIKQRLDIHLFQDMKAKKPEFSPTDFAKLEPFHWGYEFHKIFENGDGGFSVIVGNPPYIGERGNKKIFQGIKNTEFGRKFYKRKMDYFYFFFHRSIDLIKKDALIGFITTNYFITADGAIKLRSDFKNRTTINKIINFNELKIFDSAKGQHNMITMLTKSISPETIANTCTTKRRGNITKDILVSILSEDDKFTGYSLLKQNELYEGPNKYIRLSGQVSDEWERRFVEILNKIKENSVPLGKIKNVNQGVLTGADRVTDRHINNLKLNDIHKGEGIFVLTNSELDGLKLNESERNLIKPFYKNSDIFRYRTNSEEHKKNLLYLTRNLDIDDFPHIQNHLLKFEKIIRARSKDRGEMQAALKLGKWWVIFAARKDVDFDGKKIVCPQRSPTNTFGYNEEPWYGSADVYFITNKDTNETDLKYILALLNSKLYYIWLYFKGKRKGELLELFYTPLTEVPIKKTSIDNQKQFVILVDKILDITKEDNYPNNPDKQNETKKLESEIDQLVYNLYGLTEEEIKAVEEFA